MIRETLRTTARSLYQGWTTNLSRHLQPKSGRRAVFFPSNQPWDPASNLRAWQVAPVLRQRGWRVIVGPAGLNLAQRRKLLDAERPHVVLLQQTRHTLNDPALYPSYPCVMDIDDADCLDPRYAERVAAACNAAAGVIVGSSFLRDVLVSHTNSPIEVIWTGSPRRRSRAPLRPPQLRPPIVAWAHSAPLQYPLEAELVRQAMLSLSKRIQFEFWLFGSTPEGAGEWLAPLRRNGVTCRTIAPLPYQQYLDRVAEAAVGLQPVCTENEFSRGKSFGKVLAYLEGKVAVVASDAVDHALFFSSGENGMVVPNEPEQWAVAVHELLTDGAYRDRIATAGHEDYLARLTVEKSGELVAQFFNRLVGPAKPESP